MGAIIKGTTPTIRYTFSSVDPTGFTVALLKVTQDEEVIQKELSQANIGTDYIEWTLTQADTLALTERRYVTVTLDWLLEDGTRGAGQTTSLNVLPSGTDEVISNV